MVRWQHHSTISAHVTHSLGTRPFTEWRKGLGTLLHLSCPQDRMLTWPIRIVDCNLRHGNSFAPGFQCWTKYGNSLSCSVFHSGTWGEQRADLQWTYAWCRHQSLITMHKAIIAFRRDVGTCSEPLPFSRFIATQSVWNKWYSISSKGIIIEVPFFPLDSPDFRTHLDYTVILATWATPIWTLTPKFDRVWSTKPFLVCHGALACYVCRDP